MGKDQMNYYFFQGSFLKEEQFEKYLKTKSNLIFLKYTGEAKKWCAPKYDDPKLQIEIKHLVQQFQDKAWIALKKTQSYTQQCGPFSLKLIFDCLQNSTLTSATPVWKKGLSKWQKLSDTKEFAPLFHANSDLDFYSDTADILDSIMEMKPEMRRVDSANQDKNSGPIDMNEVFIIHD